MDIKIKMKHKPAGETAQGIRAPNRSARGQEFDSRPPMQVVPYTSVSAPRRPAEGHTDFHYPP